MESLKKNLIQPKKTAALVLENGEVLWGYGLGCQKTVIGELCF
jgi:Carbamoylphosphate synthase small subunit